MPVYKAPLRDMKFLLNEVFDYPSHYASLNSGENATPDVVEAILSECGKLCEEVLSPLYQPGDEEGCKLEDGVVTTPKGYKEAYEQYAMGGWQGLSAPEAYGGQGLPASMGLLKQEMMGTANWPFSMYPGLSLGAMNTIFLHGSEDQKQTYLVPLTEGRWGGTMCLTEPQCGTDLGQMKTKAEPQADGSYKLTGTKIFISSGDHDLTENIVHIVLARLPDAPKGTRGISLFIVPKFLPGADGGVGERNGVTCGSLEKKMGIKASATCVMNFDGATGFLIGPENEGLNCMFTFMNTARIGTAIQGVGPAELSYQWALDYAKERRSMRALSGKKDPEHSADALIHHADVRRMLLTQKAIAEGGRGMLYYAARVADHMVEAHTEGDEKKAEKFDDKLGFLTPILKGFLTELGNEAANLGIQVFGGHGYIREHGMEQIARDTRIGTLYEGTTGIQALDLLGRKVLLMTQGGAVREFTLILANFARKHLTDKRLRPFAVELLKLTAQWNLLTVRLMLAARKDRDMVSAAANDFLMYSGYVFMAYIWARQAAVAADKLDNGGDDAEAFYKAKLATAEFYYERLLPRAQAHATSMLSPSKNLMQLDAEDMSFTA
ncbi:MULTISPECIES: acyl-CoA dehydrogenase C-terminal domain-containing protein [Marinobacter]|jgi:alkylation response protein AidB-like acyl-CoA dehydrogenase|uniref:acyl-CoA dehydrogenase C-terminal domain-containing protein n=1 Tax=Marinobacter TaxID=2742 RepID=UPI002006605D|nr:MULTISPECIES: acyl-CoA dehydrogenase C-terminal domain-containing protein [Marinobacter]MCK7550703.1 acyl-CoA dehydrogenase C-terminal domain-containing protein [Marinobacter goseongensis]MDV3504601.1 acyl-CoA dehydrogenase C-terminal domain-containing protein [Marinobacter sp. M-5]